MNVPDLLNELLVNLRGSIDENGELPSIQRARLYRLIENLSTSEHVDAGYLRRARLALTCALNSLTKMSETVAINANRMLDLGERALFDGFDLKILDDENWRFHTAINDLLEGGEPSFVSVYAGMACFAAVRIIVYDADFETMEVGEKTLQPDEWGAEFYSSLAHSGSAVWEEKGGADARSKFWLWYLDKAVPHAWNVEVPWRSLTKPV